MSNHKVTTFGQLKRGDRFAVSRHEFRRGTGDNIKVDPAVLCDCPVHVGDEPKPFNVINLSDGRVRTFRDEEKVLVTD